MLRKVLFPEIYLRDTDSISAERAQIAIRISLISKAIAVLLLVGYGVAVAAFGVDISVVEPLFAVGVILVAYALVLYGYLNP